jgi:hypothetical protein
LRIKIFLLLFIPSLLFAQMGNTPTEVTTPPATSSSSDTLSSSKYDIEFFSFKDLSNDTYWVSIVSDKPDELIEELNGKKDKKLRIQIGEVKTDIIVDSAVKDHDNPNIINFLVSAYYKIEGGQTQIKLFSRYPNSPEVVEAVLDFKVPPVNDQPGKQPFISSISPEGGTRGDTISIGGNNFGDDIDNLTIVIYEAAKNDKGEDTYIEIDEKKPFYLSPIINEAQELKFNIPLKKDLMKGGQLRKSLKLRLFVSGRPSNFVGLTLLPPTWKWMSGFLGLVIIILFLISLFLILRGLIKTHQERDMKNRGGVKRPSIVYFFELMLTDRATNTYSLSKFQAFVWTIASIGSYSYVIISQGLLLRNGKIPDFNPSLVVLMSISYGGLIAAGGLGAKKPKNEIKAKPPELSNLFCEGGNVDLSRLQLFGFTIVSIAAYIYNLALGNPLEGLPDIPPTLLGLMGVSQTGYLGSKAIGKEIAINTVTPNHIEINQPDVQISILGSGFMQGTKILLEGVSSPIETTCKSASELTFIMPKYDKIGKLSMTLLPPSGAPISANVELEIVEAGQGGYVAPKEESDEDSSLTPAAKEELDAYSDEDKT